MKTDERHSGSCRRAWNTMSVAQSVQVVVGCLLVIVAFRSPLLDVYHLSLRNSDLSYVWLVPFLAGYLAWIRRIRWRTWHHRPSWIGVAIVVAALVLSWYGRYYDILVFWHVGAPIALIGVLVSVFGAGILRAFGPALLVLCAVAPVPGVVRRQLAIPLQDLASHITTFVLDSFDVPVRSVGHLIEINGIAVAVGEACNGMKLILPLLLIIFTLVFSLSLRGAARAALIAMSIPLALVVNIVRLLPTAIAYGYFPDSAETVYRISGFVMIPLAILMMLGLLRFLEAIDVPVARWRLVTA